MQVPCVHQSTLLLAVCVPLSFPDDRAMPTDHQPKVSPCLQQFRVTCSIVHGRTQGPTLQQRFSFQRVEDSRCNYHQSCKKIEVVHILFFPHPIFAYLHGICARSEWAQYSDSIHVKGTKVCDGYMGTQGSSREW
ncbi:unnamed protein product [Discosporangium mesarthrocarpum]